MKCSRRLFFARLSLLALAIFLHGCATPSVSPPSAPSVGSESSRPKDKVRSDLPPLDQQPEPTYQQKPRYPAEVMSTGIPGGVIVDFMVDQQGNVLGARAVGFSHAGPMADLGFREMQFNQKNFGAAAVEAILAWKFRSALKGGQPITAHLQVPIIFPLGQQMEHPGILVPAAAGQPLAPDDASVPTFELSQVDLPPRVLFKAPAQYPVGWWLKGFAGESSVDFIVDENGAVRNARALKESHSEFGVAAAAALSQWIFQPGRKDGRAVRTHMQEEIIFTLTEIH